MLTICAFTFPGLQGEEYLLQVEADETHYNHQFAVTYSISSSDELFKSELTFDLQAGVLTINNLITPTKDYLACIAACGIGNLVQKIMVCWKHGHKTPADLIACLRSKGHSISSSLVNCVINCLPSLAAGEP